jgi:hypothetical protein
MSEWDYIDCNDEVVGSNPALSKLWGDSSKARARKNISFTLCLAIFLDAIAHW